MPKPVYEQEDVTVLWNQAVRTEEVTASRSDIIIKKKNRKHSIHRSGNSRREKCRAKEAEKKLK